MFCWNIYWETDINYNEQKKSIIMGLNIGMGVRSSNFLQSTQTKINCYIHSLKTFVLNIFCFLL